MNPTFFKTATLFRTWLDRHHATHRELLVGFHKVGTGKPSITYPQALDAALCFGWIDGIRRRLDADSYTIRFTPRKRDSIWSAVNIRHVARLQADGLMQPAGLKAFRERDRTKARLYSFENRPRRLEAAYAMTFRANRRAWAWFEAQAPSYRRSATWWVMSAKREETRARRLAVLIASSAKGAKAPPFILGPEDRTTAARR
jgi:uncharacterized protein YdeI (YjbR/CyaY-like superfamily)